MIKVECIEVFNFEGAIRGLRNPLASHHYSDSVFNKTDNCSLPVVVIGEKDLKLMKTLYNAGTEHAKYLRQIFVSMDITAPLYWWKEFDTYKVGTTANSYSTMHKIHAKEFTIDDFGSEHLDRQGVDLMCDIINYLNYNRLQFGNTNDKKYWWNMIQMLPSSYNQKRTVTMNYANAMNMINQRQNHKLDCWHEFCDVLRSLPYVKEIRGEK